MNLTIIKSLKNLEERENIKILFACESGSRAWGTDSDKSDYDVRFIYIREINWYLQLYEGPETIEETLNEKIEIIGWDLKKSLKLLQKSNTTILEWIHSPIVYLCDEVFTTKLKEFADLAFSSSSTIYHYANMAKKNLQSLRKEEKGSTKKYLNILRPIVNCLWIVEYGKMPISNMTSLFHHYLNDPVMMNQFELLIQAKKGGYRHFKSQQLDIYIKDIIPIIEEKVKNVQHKHTYLTNTFNRFFIEIVTNREES